MKKIAITLPVKKLINFWSNGLGQNAITLYRMLVKQGYDIWILTDKEFQTKKAPELRNIKHKHFLKCSKKKEKFDLMIECGFSFQGGMEEHRKNIAKNSVSLKYGNELMWDLETVTNLGCTRGMIGTSLEPMGQIWTSPHYNFAREYIRVKHKASEVKIAPYVWSPSFLESAIQKSNKDPRYTPGEKKRIGVFEPNVQTTKSSLIPSMICEDAFNMGVPFDAAHIFCTEEIRKSSSVVNLFKNMNVYQAKKIFYESRYNTVFALANYVDIVLSHHTYNSLNYVTLEALYLDYPVVHNSEDFKDVGYFYKEFNIGEGAKALKDAVLTHDDNIEEYKKTAKQYIEKYSPENPKNIQGYIDLIESAIK